MTAYDRSLFWFRRDLRDHDNAGLHHALVSSRQVACAFVFDREILEALPSRSDARVAFIHACIAELREALRALGGDLVVLHGHAREEIPALAARLGAAAVFANEDYEPAAVARDEAVAGALAASGRRLHLAKDQAVFSRDEILTRGGKPFVVFTPYRRAWLAKLDDYYLKAYPVAKHAARLAKPPFPATLPSLADLGFGAAATAAFPVPAGMSGARRLFADFAGHMAEYARARDYPAREGVSRLSAHNRFGTIPIRELARAARAAGGEGADTWLSELAWRDFYFQVLWHHPHAASGAFRREYDAIAWPGTEEHFDAWREARTGYPIVDAAMRQIAATGWMHNRLRMVAASFLVKDLLVDWRRGERWFAERLLDFDLAANNGGWQWSASTGCDAQPWFRIFNPVTQSERFDPRGEFIRRWVPELARVPARLVHAPWKMGPLEQQAAGCVIGRDYPAPVIDHAAQRGKALALFRGVRA
ncbi:MAG: deoxyribodipyrimidine photo-lyase [Burkholderiales bacterium]